MTTCLFGSKKYIGVDAYKMWYEEILVVDIWGIVELVVFAFYFIFGISNDVITIRLGGWGIL